MNGRSINIQIYGFSKGIQSKINIVSFGIFRCALGNRFDIDYYIRSWNHIQLFIQQNKSHIILKEQSIVLSSIDWDLKTQVLRRDAGTHQVDG